MDYKEFLVSVEIAEALKKIGFDKNNDKVVKLYDYENKKIIEPTWEFHYRSSYFDRYLDFPNEYCPLFTYEQVFAWFREKGLVGIINTNKILNEKGEPLYFASVDDTREGGGYYNIKATQTYEEAREVIIKGLIKVCKFKKQLPQDRMAKLLGVKII